MITKHFSKDGRGIYDRIDEKVRSMISGKPVSNSVVNSSNHAGNHNHSDADSKFNKEFSHITPPNEHSNNIIQQSQKNSSGYDSRVVAKQNVRNLPDKFAKGAFEEVADTNKIGSGDNNNFKLTLDIGH